MKSKRTILSRRGFTYIELVTSLMISSVLLLGLSSVIMIASRAIPTGEEQIHTEGSVARVLETIAEDLELASGITAINSRTILIGVLDRDGDSSKDQIRYELDTDKNLLMKTWNSNDAISILSGVDSMNITLVTDSGRALSATIELEIPAMTNPTQIVRVDLFNKPEFR